MRTSDRVRTRTEAVVKVLQEHGPMSTAELAEVLGLPGPDTQYFGRKLRYIVADMTDRGITERAGTYFKYGSRSLEQFKLVEAATAEPEELDEIPPPEAPVVEIAAGPHVVESVKPIGASTTSPGLALEGRKVGAAAGTVPVATSRIVPWDLPAASSPKPRVYPSTAKLGSDRLSSRDKLSAINASGAPEKSMALRMILAVVEEILDRVDGLEDFRDRVREAASAVQERTA